MKELKEIKNEFKDSHESSRETKNSKRLKTCNDLPANL